MTNADLYLRLSVDFEGATAIERQEADCRRWCTAHNLTVRAVHVDKGVSGFSETAHRDGFDAALTAVVSGEVGTLVVWKLDRLSRRGVGQVGHLLDAFEHAGGRLVSVQDQLDTSQPQARMIIALLSEFARAESETMGVRVKAAKAAQRARGLWLSGKPPFGYTIAADRRLTPTQPAASVMSEVFQRLADGHTLLSVCALLNERGFRNSRGHRWQSSALSEAIRSPAYAGLTPARHVTANGLHAPGYPSVYRDADTGLEVSCLTRGARPVTSRATQLAALDMLQRRWTRYGRGQGPTRQAHALLLRGLGRCAACDGPLVTFNGYRCRRVNSHGDLVCIAPVNATVAAVDSRVARAWVHAVTTPDPANEQLRTVLAHRWLAPPRHTPAWARVERELTALRVRLDDADAAFYVRGELDVARHTNVAAKLTHRMTVLRERLHDTTDTVDPSGLDDPNFVTAQWEKCGYDGRRELLRLAYTKIVVAKSTHRGGQFDDDRITYLRTSTVTTSLPPALP